MPITDLQPTNQQDPATAAPQANVDAGQLVQELLRTGVIPPPQAAAAPAERRSQFQSALETLKQSSEPGAVEGMKILFNSFEADLTEKQKRETQSLIKSERDRAALNLIQMTIDNYAGDDALLKEYVPIIRDKVVHEINNKTEHQAMLNRYAQTGEIDVAAIKKIVAAEAGKLTRGRDEKPKKSNAMSGDTAKESQATVKGSRNEKEDIGDDDDSSTFNYGEARFTKKHFEKMTLGREYEPETTQEKALYGARLGTAQRAGWGREGKVPLMAARSAIKNLRDGIAKARAAGLYSDSRTAARLH